MENDSLISEVLTKTFQIAQTYHEQGNLAEAKNLYFQILQVSPDHFDSLHMCGLMSYQVGLFEEAERFFAMAADIKSDFAPLHSNRGLARHALKRFNDALASYDTAISINSDSAEVLYNRGNSLKELKRFDEALASYDQALAIKPDYAGALNNRGVVLQELNRFDEALASYDQAILIKSDYAEALANRGAPLHALKRFDEALASYDEAVLINSDSAEAFYNRGNTLKEIKRFDEALASYDRAITIKSDYGEAYWNKALLLLGLGNFQDGLRLYEWRKKKENKIADRAFSKQLWLGSEEISGKTLLVHWEQGLGDTLQFCRYIPLLIEKGARVLFAPHTPLKKITSNLGSACRIVDLGDRSLEFDYHCPLLSLPFAFKTDLESIPNNIPYLSADQDLVATWKEKIGGKGLKIGICWQGSTGKVDAGRSFPLQKLKELSQIAGVRLISLHKGAGESQLDELRDGMSVETLGADFDSGPDAFLDTAAVMKCCDLVITSDTAVAHLAGALGVKTWVALKFVPDWRWMFDGETSPWYPTMRLFRQESPGDWDEVFLKVQIALKSEF